MKKDIVWTTKFKKDYKLAEKRGLPVILLDDCIRKLASGEPLPPQYRDHDLLGNWQGFCECHIQGDWLLNYRFIDNDVVLVLSILLPSSKKGAKNANKNPPPNRNQQNKKRIKEDITPERKKQQRRIQSTNKKQQSESSN